VLKAAQRKLAVTQSVFVRWRTLARQCRRRH